MSKSTKPELVRPSSPERPVGNNQEIKKSILADVNKQIVINTSGKSGGA